MGNEVSEVRDAASSGKSGHGASVRPLPAEPKHRLRPDSESRRYLRRCAAPPPRTRRERGLGRGVYPHQLAFLLRAPQRELVFSRRRLVEALRLRPSSVALEVGPGPGFFSLAVARAIPRGRLELLDVQVPMLRNARRRIRRTGLSNVRFTCGSATRLPYRADSFDRVFLVAVLGEAPSPAECMSEIARVLRPGGLLAICELPGDPDAVPRETVTALATRLGFRAIDCKPHRGGYALTLELRGR